MAAPTTDLAELAEAAVRRISEAMNTGTMTRGDGTAVVISSDQYVKLAQWLATLKQRKPKLVNPPEDFRPKETTGEDEA